MNFVAQNITPRPLTEIDLLAWLNQALAGDALEYHRGFLALDRSFRSAMLSDKERASLGQMAGLAMRLANHGLVALVQRRNRRNDFSYLAIARARTCDLSQFL